MSEILPAVDTIVQEVRRELALRREKQPIATYRIQFEQNRFTFREAAKLVPYLSRLGVTHVYASPYLMSRSNSPHGYAIVNYGKLDPQLGTKEEYETFVQTLEEHGMGHILDFVPNHMSTAPGENRWWTNVLENGPLSPYADYFDIDWQPTKQELTNKVLLPVLGKQFGEVLEAGDLKLTFHEGAFFVVYFDSTFPLDPGTYDGLLLNQLEAFKETLLGETAQKKRKAEENERLVGDFREFESIITAIGHLPSRNPSFLALHKNTESTSALADLPQGEGSVPDKPLPVSPTERFLLAVEERQREKEVIKDRLRRLTYRCPEIAEFIEGNLKEYNGTSGEPASFDRLEELLDRQAYRLSHWKAASDEINYRRFFDVNELAAICTEEPQVFEASHALVLDLLVTDKVHGLRIDHVDGLFDPLEYLWRLQWSYLRKLGQACHEKYGEENSVKEAALPTENQERFPVPFWEELEPAFLRAMWQDTGGPAPWDLFGLEIDQSEEVREIDSREKENQETGQAKPTPLYVLVEKILDRDEPIPNEWPVAGTTGYDFLNLVNGLYLNQELLPELMKIYHRYSHTQTTFGKEVYQGKQLILRVSMASELYLLAHQLSRIAASHRHSRDFTLNTLRTALREILARLPVYRTYVGLGGASQRDREIIRRITGEAQRSNPAMDAAVFDFISEVLVSKQPIVSDETISSQRRFFIGKFQQLSSPVKAKGVEDTVFYRYFPLLSVNEVGSDPTGPVVTLERFHEENQKRLVSHPYSMLATSTHDTKRSEDVRARINVLSEIPQLWRRALNRWTRANRRFHRNIDGQTAPSRNDEYLFYQTLVGVWPLEPVDENRHQQLIDRMVEYMRKATREAKISTSWISPNDDYDHAVQEFVEASLRSDPQNRFLNNFKEFQEKVLDWSLFTALSQTFLKLTSPGVPDIYQGQELWDFCLVDPDNRRAIDFSHRRRLLEELAQQWSGDPSARQLLARNLAASPRDKRLKLFLTWRTLSLRKYHAQLFQQGQYQPLSSQGDRAENVCAFAWHETAELKKPQKILIAIAPRLVAKLASLTEDDKSFQPMGSKVWSDTILQLPSFALGNYRNVFTDQIHSLNSETVRVADLLTDFPVALLERYLV